MAHPLRKFFYRSLGLHAGLLVLLLIAPYLPSSRYRHFKDKIIWVNVPKGAANQLGSPLKKAKDLPQTTIQEQKKALESPPVGEQKPLMTYKPPESKKAEPPRPAPPKRPGHPASRIDEALARMQKQAATKKAEPEAAQVPETRPGGFTFGNTTGPYVAPNDPEYVLYQAKIRQRIMNEWIIPVKFTDQALGLVCKIVVHVNDRGEVMQKEWEQPSGNPAFDMSAMRAVEKSSPLDIPPERLKYEVFNEGFIVEFKPSQ